MGRKHTLLHPILLFFINTQKGVAKLEKWTGQDGMGFIYPSVFNNTNGVDKSLLVSRAHTCVFLHEHHVSHLLFSPHTLPPFACHLSAIAKMLKPNTESSSSTCPEVTCYSYKSYTSYPISSGLTPLGTVLSIHLHASVWFLYLLLQRDPSLLNDKM